MKHQNLEPLNLFELVEYLLSVNYMLRDPCCVDKPLEIEVKDFVEDSYQLFWGSLEQRDRTIILAPKNDKVFTPVKPTLTESWKHLSYYLEWLNNNSSQGEVEEHQRQAVVDLMGAWDSGSLYCVFNKFEVATNIERIELIEKLLQANINRLVFNLGRNKSHGEKDEALKDILQALIICVEKLQALPNFLFSEEDGF